MTLFGVDISNNNPGLSPADFAREGFAFMFAKVSEGDYFSDQTWASYRDQAEAAGLVIAGYHYARASCAPAAQVAKFESTVGDPSTPVMIDFEDGSGTIDDLWALTNAFNAAGRRVALTYLPHWYWQNIGSPDLSKVPGLIASSYVGGSGYASQLYPGDNGFGWAGYGGASPVIWQFSDQAAVDNARLDVNAYRGTVDELRALLTGTPATGDDMTPQESQQQQEIWDQLRGPAGQGWAQLGGHTLVDAVAIIGQHLGLPGFAFPPPAPPGAGA